MGKLKKAKPHLKTHITWIPGHKDVDGNKKVGTAAKETAKGETIPLKCRIPVLDGELSTSIAALKATHKKQAAAECASSWQDSPRAEKLKHFDCAPPLKRVLKLYVELPRCGPV